MRKCCDHYEIPNNNLSRGSSGCMQIRKPDLTYHVDATMQGK